MAIEPGMKRILILLVLAFTAAALWQVRQAARAADTDTTTWGAAEPAARNPRLGWHGHTLAGDAAGIPRHVGVDRRRVESQARRDFLYRAARRRLAGLGRAPRRTLDRRAGAADALPPGGYRGPAGH